MSRNYLENDDIYIYIYIGIEAQTNYIMGEIWQ